MTRAVREQPEKRVHTEILIGVLVLLGFAIFFAIMMALGHSEAFARSTPLLALAHLALVACGENGKDVDPPRVERPAPDPDAKSWALTYQIDMGGRSPTGPADLLTDTMATLRLRLDAFGYEDATVERTEAARIRIRPPFSSQVELSRVKSLLTRAPSTHPASPSTRASREGAGPFAGTGHRP